VTLVEAINVIRADKDRWARPVSWRGSAIAVYAFAGALWVVTGKGEERPYTACVRDVIDAWEVLKPGEVFSEMADENL